MKILTERKIYQWGFFIFPIHTDTIAQGAELIAQAVAKVEAFDDEFFSILTTEQSSFNAQLHKLLTN